jgi:hypothetical protein
MNESIPQWQTSTVEAVMGGLSKRLTTLCSEKRFQVYVVEFSDSRYMQFFIQPNRTITGEVMSTLHGVDWALNSDDEDELRRIGFGEPREGPYPNWTYRCRDWRSRERLVSMMHLAVYQVLKEQRKNKVSVRVEGFQLMAGESFEHFLIENRGYYVKLTDPELVRELVEELDDADKFSSYLDEWR